MGHTHYWTFAANADRTRYKQAKTIIAEFIPYAISRGYKIVNAMGEAGTKPVLKKFIAFNGEGDDGYETFYLDGTAKEGFNFCKTNEHAYDAVVVACMLLMKGEMGNDVHISSDGIGKLGQPEMYFDLGEGMALLIDFINTKDMLDNEQHIEDIIKCMVNWFNHDNINVQYDEIINKCAEYSELIPKK